MAERLTRSRVQGGVSPTVIDPTAELLRLFSEARQDAIAVLQDCVDGRRKLSEACAKVRQASAQILEMVRDDLEYLEDPMGEGGGLAKPTTARLPQAQAGRALSLLVDACHLTMRAVLHHREQGEQPVPAKQQSIKDAAAAVGGSDDGRGGSPDAVAFDRAMGSAQLWRAAVSVATALADATRLLAVPRFYSAFTIANPSCDGLLSVGELAAAVMRNAAATSVAATAAARGQQSGGRVQVKSEEESSLTPPDASCLLAAHGSSLLLVACEAQPEGLLDALLRQPGGSERLHVIATSTLELAAARIAETGYCGGCDGGTAAHGPARSGITAGPLDRSTLSPPSSSAFPFSYYFRQLQLVAVRFAELLADDGSYKAMAKQALLPALADALLAEPHRFISWWGCGKDALLSGLSARDLLTAPQLTDRSPAAAAAAATSPAPTPATAAAAPGSPSAAQLLLQQQPPDCTSSHDDKLQTAAVGLLLKSPAARNNILPILLACVRLPGGGSGLAAFGDCFLEERFICAGEGVEREELYVGGRGRGYKRRKILNPDAHGVNPEQVGAVLTAMATALEWAVLLCKMLSNASVDPPSTEAAEGPEAADGERAPGDAGGVKPSRPQASKKDPRIGPPKTERRGGAATTDVGAAARATPYNGGKQEPVGDLSDGAQDDSPRATGMVPLASTFFNLLEARCSAGARGPVKREVSDAAGGGLGGAAPEGGALAMACRQVAQMARNLGMLLSLLLPVCPGGGEELRDSLRQLGYQSLRWPKMNVRLPILVVDQDCELLQVLLEDLSSSASEVMRRQNEERRLRDTEVKGLQEREDRRPRRQELEQKETERRQRDKERRQKDRDRAKAVGGDMAVGGDLEGSEMALMSQEYGPDGGGDAMGAAAAATGAHQPRVRLVLRRGGPGGDGPGTANVAQLMGSPTVEADFVARHQKRSRPIGEIDYDEERDVRDDDGYEQPRCDPVFAARLAAVGGPPDVPYGLNGMVGEPEIEGEEAAALLGLQVPRQRRSTRPMRPHTPTPPPEVLDQRVKACGPVTVVPKATTMPSDRRASASVGLGGGSQVIAAAVAGGPGAGRRHPASLHLRTGPGGVVGFAGADNDGEHDAIIGPPPAGGGGGGGFPSAPHSHPPMSAPGAMPRHLQQQHQQQLPGPYGEGPSPLRQSPLGTSAGMPAHPSSHLLSGGSGTAVVTGQHPGQQQMVQQQQMVRQQQQMQQQQMQQQLAKQQQIQQQQIQQQQEHPPARSHSAQQHQQQQQYFPQQQQHFSQYPPAQYPPQKQFEQQQYAQQQLLQQQQQRMEAAGLAGGEAAGFRRAFPQYQQQQVHPQKPHVSGGGGSGYVSTSADNAQAEQRQASLDPHSLVQQQLQYQQQSYQQQYQYQ